MPNFNIRTIDDIFQELLTEKNTLSTLDGLITGGITDENTLITALTNGKVPEFILWLYNFAVASNITDISSLSAINEINTILSTDRIHTLNWYIQKAKSFQYGDIPVVGVNDVVYSTDNPSLKIVSSCTGLEGNNRLILKIRRISTNILSSPELIAFTSYMFKCKDAGTQIIIQNYNPDQISINMTIIYDGIYTQATIQSAIETAINDYIVNIEFDSKFNSNKLLDKLQLIAGVIDPRINSISALDDLGVNTTVVHEYSSTAGYMIINPAYPLSTSINYIAK